MECRCCAKKHENALTWDFGLLNFWVLKEHKDPNIGLCFFVLCSLKIGRNQLHPGVPLSLD